MEYLAIGLIGTGLWIAYEMYTAPTMDDNGNIIKEGKKLSNLFKRGEEWDS